MRKFVLVLAVAALAGIASAQVIFQDSFDSKTPGVGIHYASPEVGSYLWVDYSQVWYSYDGGVVSNEQSRSPGNSLKVYRQTTPLIYPYPTAQGSYDPAEIVSAGSDPVRFEVSWMSPEIGQRPSIAFDLGATGLQMGSVYVDIHGVYQVYDGSAYHSTGVTAGFGVWNSLEYIATPQPDAGGGYFNVVIDAYITIDNGPKVALIEGLVGQSYIAPSEYNNVRMMLLADAPNNAEGQATIYYDDILMEKVPEPATMLLLGMGSLALLKRRK